MRENIVLRTVRKYKLTTERIPNNHNVKLYLLLSYEGNPAYFFPTLCSVTSCWQFKLSHDENIYITEISKGYKSGFELLFCYLSKLRKVMEKMSKMQMKLKSMVYYEQRKTLRQYPSSIRKPFSSSAEKSLTSSANE